MKAFRTRKSNMITGVLLCLILFAAGASARAVQAEGKDTVLEVGLFAGSNWDVANANSFVIIDKAIARFEEDHPGVKVHYYSGIRKEDYSEWLSRKLLSGDEPDLFVVLDSDFNLFCSLGILQDLEELIQKDDSFEREQYFSTALKSGEYHGVQYALPYETVPVLMFVNKTLLDREGIEMPGEDWTWDDLYDICSRVSRDTDGDQKLDQYGVCNYGWKDACYANGAALFAENGSAAYLTNPEVSEALRFLRRLEGLSQGDLVTQEDYNHGNVAFMPLNFAEYRTYKTYPDKIKKYDNFEWDCLTMPAGYSGGNISRIDSLVIGISRFSKEKNLAWEFLKLLTYDQDIQTDIFRYSQGASVLRPVTQSEEMEMILLQDMEKGDTVISGELLGTVIENGHTESHFGQYIQAMSMADSRITEIIEGNNLIDTELKILQREIDSILGS